jgi:eukaryotic-like serine/threonine-protein kinase
MMEIAPIGMKYCEKCQNSFANTVKICPNDGSLLTDSHKGEKNQTLFSLDFRSEQNSLSGDLNPEEESLLGDYKFEEDSLSRVDIAIPEFNIRSLIGKTIDGKYHIESLLGIGGMGAVYRARHAFISNDVAIKIIHPRQGMSNKTGERFLREAKVAVMVDHPNAVKVTDFGSSGGMLYLVMEFIQGQSLSDLIRKRGYLNPSDTAEIMGQICAALDSAHSNNIIHRDLKPENIMIKQNDRGQRIVKVLDFGLAKMLTLEGSAASLTSADTVVGTLNYMSPEQCRGEEVIDSRSDIYSLGVVAFEMLTGKLPFSSSRPTGLLSKHMFELPPRLRSIRPEIPEAVERVVLRALEKKANQRYRTAGEFASELSQAAEGTDSPVLSIEIDRQAERMNRAMARSYSGDFESDLPSNITQQVDPPQTESVSYEFNFNNGISKADKLSELSIEGFSAPPSELTPGLVSSASVPTTRPVNRRKILIATLAVVLLIGVSGGYLALQRSGGKRPAEPGSQTAPSDKGMVLIQGGWLRMGSLEGYEFEQPVHEVLVDSFYMDEMEVTNEQFRRFVEETGYISDAENSGNKKNNWKTFASPDRNNHPVVLVSWNDANAYAKWAGKRLPTEAEWEYAARGGLVGMRYPWGDEPPPRRANFDRGRRVQTPPTEPVKSYEPNGYGLYDMAGNVSEWCQDWYDPDYYRNSPERNPGGPSTGESRVIRGGSWYTDFNQLRTAGRISEFPGGYEYDRGFRCAKSQ